MINDLSYSNVHSGVNTLPENILNPIGQGQPDVGRKRRMLLLESQKDPPVLKYIKSRGHIP